MTNQERLNKILDLSSKEQVEGKDFEEAIALYQDLRSAPLSVMSYTIESLQEMEDRLEQAQH